MQEILAPSGLPALWRRPPSGSRMMLPTLAEFLLALPWLLTALLAPFLLRRRPWLSDNPAPVRDAPFVSIIVPARNEAANLPGLVATLLCSTYSRYEIVIVDDRSTDGTTGIIGRLAANHSGIIRAVEGEPLPAGWVGKCWACWQGYRAARGDVLVFTDADTRHHENLLGHAVGALDRNRAGLVTAFPRQLMLTFWEKLIQPHVFAAIAIRFPDGERVNRSRLPRDVLANGQFLAFTRECYEAIGGHEAVRAEIVEDLVLAQVTVASGRRMYMAWADDLIATRMYRSLPEIVEGWSKNLARASRQSVDPWLRPLLPWLIALFMIGFWAVPPIALLISFVPPAAPVGWSLTASLAALAFWIFMYRRFSVPPTLALLYPAGAIATAALFLRSALRGGTIEWKGRTYNAAGLDDRPDRTRASETDAGP